MVVHRPEHCYRSAGYEMIDRPTSLTVEPKDGPPAEMWTALFAREQSSGTDRLRIFWSWLGSDRWEASASPRWRFARQRVLYKMYVIRNATQPIPLHADPCVQLLGQLLPVLERELKADAGDESKEGA
jgi:hypothetical protein